jgi:hypothetical protein
MPLSFVSFVFDEFSQLTPVHKSVTLAAQAALLGSIWASYKALSSINKQKNLRKPKSTAAQHPKISTIPKRFLEIHVLRKQQITQFSLLAQATISSSQSILTQEYFLPADAYAALPLIKQLREKGERLSSSRKRLSLGSVQSLQSEIDLRMVISELRLLENQIKRLPRSKIALAEVLEGKFNEEYLPQEAARSES